MDIFTFTWHFENLRMCPLKQGEYLSSPTFQVDVLQGTKWHLKLYPKGEGNGNGRFPSLYLSREGAGCDPETVTVGHTVSLVTEFDVNMDDGVTRTVCETQSTRFRKDEQTARDDFLRLGLMFCREEEFLVRGGLVVKCRIWPAVASADTKESTPSEVMRVGDSDFAVVCRTSGFPSPSGRQLFGERAFWCQARTAVAWERRIVNWTVENFESLELGDTVRRPTPIHSFEGGSELELTLQKTGCSTDPIQLRFDIRLRDNLPWRTFTRLELLVHDDIGEVFTIYEDEHFFERLDEMWSIPLVIETRSNGVGDSVLTREGQLVFKFVFSISRKRMDFSHRSNDDLKSKIRRLYEDGKFCDVTIRSSDRTFSVHKNVLCARSDVFCAMFENDTKEKNTGIVDVPDVDSDTMDRMLTFMYSDKLDNVRQEDALKLYSATDKYQVQALKRMCASYLVAGLSVSSVCDVLELAELHQDIALKNSVLNFINVNAKEIFSSCSWMKFMESNCRLTGKIMHNILVKKLEL